MVQREILAVLESNEKGGESLKPVRSHPPKLVCMHFTSTSTCINFLSRFLFLTPMVQRNNLAVLNANRNEQISKT